MQATVTHEDKATCVSPSRHFHSPRKEELRRHIVRTKKMYQGQLKMLKEKNRRNTKKIQNLRTILDTLQKKNLLQGEEVETLEGISSFQSELLQRMTRTNAKRQYSENIRLFALTLHYYSPRAYSYVREKFGLCIPHQKTIHKWYQSIDGEPGFNSEAIRYLKDYSKDVDNNPFASLIIDEMSIR